MKEILSLRRKIDEIDDQIIVFLKERVAVCKSIGAIKRKREVSIRDSHREDELYTRVMRRASELGLSPHEVRAVYREIIAMCVRAQRTTRLAPNLKKQRVRKC